jgi:hypothetical protein
MSKYELDQYYTDLFYMNSRGTYIDQVDRNEYPDGCNSVGSTPLTTVLKKARTGFYNIDALHQISGSFTFPTSRAVRSRFVGTGFEPTLIGTKTGGNTPDSDDFKLKVACHFKNDDPEYPGQTFIFTFPVKVTNGADYTSLPPRDPYQSTPEVIRTSELNIPQTFTGTYRLVARSQIIIDSDDFSDRDFNIEMVAPEIETTIPGFEFPRNVDARIPTQAELAQIFPPNQFSALQPLSDNDVLAFCNGAAYNFNDRDIQAKKRNPDLKERTVKFAAKHGEEQLSAFPNPFTGQTTLRFVLPEASQARLWVTDLTGRHVQTLTDAHHKEGAHQFTFDAAGLAPGVYLYTIQTENGNETKRLLLE